MPDALADLGFKADAPASDPLAALGFKADDPVHAKPSRPEDLPSRERLEASHQAAVADLNSKLSPPTPTMSAAPEPGFLERLKRVILGNPQGAPGETDRPIGRALGISYEAPTEPHTPTTSLPLAGFTALAPQNPQSVAGGVAKGAAEFAEGMTTAPNLLMAAGSGGLGLLGKVSSYLPRAVSAAFSLDMLRSAYQQVPDVKAAIDKQDWPGAAAAITRAGLTAGLGVAAGAHALRGGTARISPSEEGVKPEVKSPSAKAVESARAGAAALDDLGFKPEAAPEPAPAAKALDDLGFKPEQEPAAEGQPGESGRRVTGSANPSLNENGREQMQDLAERTAGQFTRINTTPMSRGVEGAQIVAAANPQARLEVREGLGPLKLGEHEGQPAEQEQPAINDRIRNRPDEPAPGVSQHSGEPGESFNTGKDRFIGEMQQQALEMQPGDRVLNVTHGRQIRMLQAWAKAGFPEDGSIDTKEMTREGDWAKAGQLLYLDPETEQLEPVENAAKPGQYVARHGETDFSAEGPARAADNISPESKPAASPEVAHAAMLAENRAGRVMIIPTSEIHADPVRFRFKANVGQKGVGEEFKGVTRFDPEKSGVVSVWQDPADGKTYVVNGHHRLEMAERLGAPDLAVRYLDAPDAKTARLKGALINIAEGRGDGIDAAKVFRDGGLDAAALEREGISLKGEKASQGLALANLEPGLFSKVVSGDLPVERAAVIGRGVPNPEDQKALADLLDQRERSGKRLTNDQVAEMIRLTNEAPKQTETQESLFGAQEMTRSLIPEKAEVSDFIRRRLGQEKKLFATVGTESAAEQLGSTGNVIKAGENARVAERAGQAQALYDKLSTSAGPISDALDSAAQAIAKGENANAAKERAYGQVKAAVLEQAEKLAGQREVPVERSEGNVAQGSDRAGAGQRSEVESQRVPPSGSEHVDFRPGQSDHYHAAFATVKPIELTPEESQRAAAYVANPSAMELLGRAGGFGMDEVGRGTAGLHVSPAFIGRVTAKLSKLVSRALGWPATQAELLHPILRLFKTADGGKSLVFVSDGSQWDQAMRETALAEELNHARQASLTGVSQRHMGSQEGDFLKLPEVSIATRALRAKYGEAPNPEEIGVRLMEPGRYKELGLSLAQARSLGTEYVRALEREYGDVPAREITKRVNDALWNDEGASEEGATQPGAVHPGPEDEGRGGPSGGAGPDLSAFIPGESRELGRGRSGADDRVSPEETPLFGRAEQEQVARESAADRDKLEGERLTAQFNAPVSREEQLRKLKPGEKPPQTNLFEATPAKSQFSLFGDERGSVDPNLLSLGAAKFVEKDVIPAAKKVAGDLVEAKDQALRMVAPQLRGPGAEYTGLSLRQRMAQFARRYDQGAERLKAARDFFNTRTAAENYKFIDDIEHGRKTGDENLDAIAGTFRRMLDQRRREVQQLGEGELERFYANYFPHIFERPEQASKFFESFFGDRRRMEGPKSFLQHREFPTFAEALDAGQKPVSDNPVELVMMKAREMDRYLLAHAVLRDLAERGIAKRVTGQQAERVTGQRVLKPNWEVTNKGELPANFTSIRDPIGGGKWYAEQGASDVLNNYLTPGLRAKSGAYRILAGINNTMNQANLGLSAFHLTGEIIRSGVSRAALGIEDLIHGKPLRGSLRIASAPAGPFLDYVRGSKVLRDWFKPGSEGAPIAAITDALMAGGGRVRMDAAFRTDATDSMMKALREGNLPGAIIRAPWALLEKASHPMMENIIPRLKLGVFHGMAQDALERLGPGADVEQVRKAMAPIWDSVDNRMGQVVYDNLFWNRTFKDLSHIMVRSVGWNLGTIREIGGGTLALKNPMRWRDPEVMHKVAYTLVLPLVSGMIGALYQYAHTGQGPQELKDYFFPKRENGQRIAMPTDVKDVYHYSTDPVRTVENKTSPMLNTMVEMLHNRDFYDKPIRNLDDPVVKQLGQEADFVGRQFLPFTVTQQMAARKGPQESNPEHKVENYLGFTRAPGDIQGGKKHLAPKSKYGQF